MKATRRARALDGIRTCALGASSSGPSSAPSQRQPIGGANPRRLWCACGLRRACVRPSAAISPMIVLKTVLNMEGEVVLVDGELFMYMGPMPPFDAQKLASGILELGRTPAAPVLHWAHKVLALRNATYFAKGALTGGGARGGAIVVKDGNIVAAAAAYTKSGRVRAGDAIILSPNELAERASNLCIADAFDSPKACLLVVVQMLEPVWYRLGFVDMRNSDDDSSESESSEANKSKRRALSPSASPPAIKKRVGLDASAHAPVATALDDLGTLRPNACPDAGAALGPASLAAAPEPSAGGTDYATSVAAVAALQQRAAAAEASVLTLQAEVHRIRAVPHPAAEEDKAPGPGAGLADDGAATDKKPLTIATQLGALIEQKAALIKALEDQLVETERTDAAAAAAAAAAHLKTAEARKLARAAKTADHQTPQWPPRWMANLMAVPIEDSGEDESGSEDEADCRAAGLQGWSSRSYEDKKLSARFVREPDGRRARLLEHLGGNDDVAPGLVAEFAAQLWDELRSSTRNDSDDMLRIASQKSFGLGFTAPPRAARSKPATGAPAAGAAASAAAGAATEKQFLAASITEHVNYVAMRQAKQDQRHIIDVIARCVAHVLAPPAPAAPQPEVKSEKV
ncbi:hypothetical protein M885DRAFT_627201 [Pelagophyceae sp. CCMP2097]|nr:hypothetical protein M885DRAFT_627201 [Pelagophyceae sp. CCMP2097]